MSDSIPMPPVPERWENAAFEWKLGWEAGITGTGSNPVKGYYIAPGAVWRAFRKAAWESGYETAKARLRKLAKESAND